MKPILAVALGILSAIGGFVDIGDIVFNAQAGAHFGYELVWVVVLGVLGIAFFSEMCGRVAAVSKRPVFDLVRERVGFSAGLLTLIAAEIVTLMTCTAELGGVAIVLELLSGWPYRLLAVAGVLVLLVVAWVLPFEWIERVFGYAGLGLLVFTVAAVALGPDWGALAHGLVPGTGSHDGLVFAYFAIGLLGAAMTPYEVYFYSSGAVEDDWGSENLRLNRVTAFLGYGLGGLLSISIMVVAAVTLHPDSASPASLGSVAVTVAGPLGLIALVAALVGMLFAIAGAAIETGFSGAYNVAQFFGWEWGKHRRPREAPRFAVGWIALLLLGLAIVQTGIDPVMLTEYAVIFSVVALPLTYIPILVIANDRDYMGAFVNGRITNVVGSVFLVVIAIVAITAVPLMLLTGSGTG